MPDGVEAQSPDDFLLNLYGLAPVEMVELLCRQAPRVLFCGFEPRDAFTRLAGELITHLAV